MSGIDKVIAKAGGVKPLADYLGIRTQAIYLWKRKGYVSAERALELERAYKVPRLELMRPDLVESLTNAKRPRRRRR